MAFNVADLFEHAVDAVPDRIALICADRHFTYRELDERANRLAHHLAACGIGAGDHVGVYARSSAEALETMLATYKLRAVSVCVDHTQGPRVKFSAQAVLLDDDGNLVEPRPGAVGRMARTGHVPLGYYKDPEKTRSIFAEVDGKRYVAPGDYARYEADGTVTLLGRGSECINTGGEKVFPEEVETALKSHPEVFDALVIGIPHDRFGQAVAAVVQPRPGAALALGELDAHLRTRIAGYKAPRGYWLVDEVMRQPSGKANYPAAKRYAAEHAEGMRSPR
ncbi:AMP-binding protein [Nocardia sp. NPDC004860]|uniref:AMP-binding protein n=1 Tax=Nocardia sp. NPDC004860 TaxID=3154557 RepID=UPI0033BD4AD6